MRHTANQTILSLIFATCTLLNATSAKASTYVAPPELAGQDARMSIGVVGGNIMVWWRAGLSGSGACYSRNIGPVADSANFAAIAIEGTSGINYIYGGNSLDNKNDWWFCGQHFSPLKYNGPGLFHVYGFGGNDIVVMAINDSHVEDVLSIDVAGGNDQVLADGVSSIFGGDGNDTLLAHWVTNTVTGDWGDDIIVQLGGSGCNGGNDFDQCECWYNSTISIPECEQRLATPDPTAYIHNHPMTNVFAAWLTCDRDNDGNPDATDECMGTDQCPFDGTRITPPCGVSTTSVPALGGESGVGLAILSLLGLGVFFARRFV